MIINKIAHLSDIHLMKTPTRNDEYRTVFKRLYKSLRDEKPELIIITGDFVNDYIDLQGEQIVLASEFLNELSEIAMVRIIRGNHDYHKARPNRTDSIEAIVKAINNPNLIYLNETGLIKDNNITWAVWKYGDKHSPWEKHNKVREDNQTYIDLYHDTINGCVTPHGLKMKGNNLIKKTNFLGDYLFAGHIHKQQFLNKEKTAAYAGSLIAQDFSEGDNSFHGYLLWDIENKDVKLINIPNDYSYKTIIISQYTDFDDLDFEIDDPTKYNRLRFNWVTLPETKTIENQKKVEEYITKKYKDQVISIKHQNQFIEETTIGDTVDDNQLATINDNSTQHSIFKTYLSSRGVDDEIINEIIQLDETITDLMKIDKDSNGDWDIVKFGGRNFMSYEEIDLDWRNVNGLIQLAGYNARGKTTIFKLISYLFYGKTLETESRVKFGDSRYVNNRNNAKSCLAYGVIKSNGKYYGIKRETKLKFTKDGELSGAPTTVSYYILDDPDDKMNDQKDINKLDETLRKKTQSNINAMIGSYDNFNRIILTTSDTLNRVLSNEMAVFIDSLLFDSGLDIFDKKHETVKAYNKKRLQNNRISCDETQIKNDIENSKNRIQVLNNEIEEITEKDLPDLDNRIKIGDEYVESLLKKLHKIDDEVYNLDINQTNNDIENNTKTINDLKTKNQALSDRVNSLPEQYNKDRLDELNDLLNKNKESVNSIKYENRGYENEINTEQHQIEILNGKIFTHNRTIKGIEQKIDELQSSKICPVCKQTLKKDERNHINQLIEDQQKETNKLTDEIEVIKTKDIIVHQNKISEIKQKIKNNTERIDELVLSNEPILNEIGLINNQKNDVDKRNGLLLEIANNKVSMGGIENKINQLQLLIEKHKLMTHQIEVNKKITRGISLAKEKLNNLRSQRDSKHNAVSGNKQLINNLEENIKKDEKILADYKKQEHVDYIVKLYTECVHRDGIPRLMLTNHIIPQINNTLDSLFKTLDFHIWIDLSDLKPKLRYYDRPDAIIDCISSSGMERTFSSIGLKFALNQINIKSKPMFLLLDEVMGKLVEESVDQFQLLLESLKDYVNRVMIVEHNTTINADHIYHVDMNNNGISKITLK
ncbi:MAG: metallophosphoesterase [bacterium]